MRRISIRVALIALSILLGVFVSCRAQKPAINVQLLATNAQPLSPVIQAELAVSASEKQLGLMYRKHLGETEGMLFIFPDESLRSFWMKNTYVELDIIFLDASLRVVSISERATPLTETKRSSTAPAKYVLEVRGGMSKTWGVGPGSVLKVDGALPAATS